MSAFKNAPQMSMTARHLFSFASIAHEIIMASS